MLLLLGPSPPPVEVDEVPDELIDELMYEPDDPFTPVEGEFESTPGIH